MLGQLNSGLPAVLRSRSHLWAERFGWIWSSSKHLSRLCQPKILVFKILFLVWLVYLLLYLWLFVKLIMPQDFCFKVQIVNYRVGAGAATKKYSKPNWHERFGMRIGQYSWTSHCPQPCIISLWSFLFLTTLPLTSVVHSFKWATFPYYLTKIKLHMLHMLF